MIKTKKIERNKNNDFENMKKKKQYKKIDYLFIYNIPFNQIII